MAETITIPTRFQGVTGLGQGGYAAGLLAERIDGPATADFFNPIPLDRPLDLVRSNDRLELHDGPSLILRVRPFTGEIGTPEPVSIDDAEAARQRSPVHDHDVIPDCFSCGTIPDSMQVHAGPLPDRQDFATPWTPPEWAGNTNGIVADRYVWAAIDCPSGWRATTLSAKLLNAVTGQMRTKVTAPILTGQTYALVSWSDPWKGRRVKAGTALFDQNGTCLATSQAVWISI
ncbi:MAG TPA: hypothetical protein ENH15_02755 [Actinobacteria bacterium]|nr:hypothetical protein [Actinomycetota bacterium]